jgi:D-amino peptidase
VTGDEAVCREAAALTTPPPVTVAVKRGIGRFSAIHLHPEAAHRLIEEKTAQALRDVRSVGVYHPAEPCTVEVQFTSPEIAQGYLSTEGIEPAGHCGIRATGPTWRDAWRLIGW